MTQALLVKNLGVCSYLQTFEQMKAFTQQRTADTLDELWVLSHPAVYTLGQAGKSEHILRRSEIPIVQVDRGGQITYHGPGQVIVYLLLDLHRRKLFVRDLVFKMEQALIDTLAHFSIDAVRNPGAPGVYVAQDKALAKIAALGIKVTRGFTYHGLALNIDMDLKPFDDINPCGYQGLKTIDMASLLQNNTSITHDQVQDILLTQLKSQLI